MIEQRPLGLYIEIEISRAGEPFVAAEFETLKAGDRFRVTSPPDHYAVGRIYTARDDAKVAPGEGNWGVIVDKIEGAR